MGKRRATLIPLLILSLTLLVLSTPIQLEVKAAEQVLFEDDFESYSVGTFPSAGGWRLWYSGMGSEYQMIVDDFSNSPTNSLQLLGDHSRNWAAYSSKLIDTDQPIIGFSVSVMVESLGGGDARPRSDVARVGFATLVPPVYATSYAPIFFADCGIIKAMGGYDLQSYVADRWYKVTLTMDRNAETYSVWIDDVLVGENLPVMTNKGPMEAGETPWEIDGFAVSQNYYSTKAYFDDVKIFTAFDLDPKLELVPAEGIAATTLVGSGFAPNSHISITWDSTPIPTVPSPLITDGYGNFTAIISILNQTAPGIYTVKAVDEIGSEANATYTVYSNNTLLPQNPPIDETETETNATYTAYKVSSSSSSSIEELAEQQNQREHPPEFPSWIILPPLLLIAALFVLVIKRKRFHPASQQ